MKQEWIEFVKAAIKNPMAVSTIFPTTPMLAQCLLTNLPTDPGLVIEVGTGTGAITKFLLPRLKELQQSYLGIDISLEMIQFMRKEYPGVRFECGTAEGVTKRLDPESATAVVSSLPWTMFSIDTQNSTLKAICQSLQPRGVFMTYMCLNTSWTPLAKSFSQSLYQHFAAVEKSSIVWRNIPPAFVYTCKKSV